MNRRAFTLVELLVVIAIIGILVALLLPAVQTAREAARRVQCTNKIRQLALAAHNYHSAERAFPAGSTNESINKEFSNCTSGGNRPGKAPWTVLILPYLEEQSLYDAFNLNERFTSTSNVPGSPTNHEVFKRDVSAFKCNSDPVSAAGTNYMTYLGVQGGGPCPKCTSQSNTRLFYDNGVLHLNSRVGIRKIKDGTTKTFMIGESRYVDQSVGVGQYAPGWSGWASSAKQGSWAMPMTLAAATLLGINGLDPIEVNPLTPTAGKTLDFQTRAFGSHHPGGAQFALSDGSVSFFNDDIDTVLFFNYAIRDDGHVGGAGQYSVGCGDDGGGPR